MGKAIPLKKGKHKPFTHKKNINVNISQIQIERMVKDIRRLNLLQNWLGDMRQRREVDGCFFDQKSLMVS